MKLEKALEVYPATIVCDRYNGTYSRGKYLAFNLDPEEVPWQVGAGDMDESEFWGIDGRGNRTLIGKGDTPHAALIDLAEKLGAHEQETKEKS